MFVLLGPKGPWGVGGSIKQQQLTGYRSCRWQDAAPGPGTAGASKGGTISSNPEMPLAKPFRQRGSSVIFRFLVYMRFPVPEQNPEFLPAKPLCVTVRPCVSVCVIVCHCVSLCVTVCHCVYLCVTVRVSKSHHLSRTKGHVSHQPQKRL